MEGSVPHLKDLARIFGVTDDTITAWKANGAPAGPPYSVVEWYLWARSKGYSPRTPDDEQLARLCARGARNQTAADGTSEAAKVSEIPAHLVSIGKELGIDPPDEWGIENDGDRVLAWQRWGQAIKSALEIGEKRKELIPIKRVREVMTQLANSVLEEFNEVFTVSKDIESLTHQQRTQLRDALQAWINRTRLRLSRKMSP